VRVVITDRDGVVTRDLQIEVPYIRGGSCRDR
jgi:hypothetical protein